MSEKLRTHKDLDAWERSSLITGYPLLITVLGFGWHAIVDEVAKWAGAFKDVKDE